VKTRLVTGRQLEALETRIAKLRTYILKQTSGEPARLFLVQRQTSHRFLQNVREAILARGQRALRRGGHGRYIDIDDLDDRTAIEDLEDLFCVPLFGRRSLSGRAGKGLPECAAELAEKRLAGDGSCRSMFL